MPIFAKLITAAELATVGFLACVGYALLSDPFRSDVFSTRRWHDLRSCEGLTDSACDERRASCGRGGMAWDLLTRHLQPGRIDRAGVEALIGPPDGQTRIFQDHARPRECSKWFLGFCSGFLQDGDSLYVCYDASGRIDRAGRFQH